MADINNPNPAEPTAPASVPPTPEPAPVVPPTAPATPPPPQTPVGPGAEAAVPSAGEYISNPLALIKPSWAAFKLNLWQLVIPGLVALAAIAALAGSVLAAAFLNNGAPAPTFGAGFFGVIILTLILVVLFAPYGTIVLLAGARGEKISFGDAIKRTPHFSFRFLGVGLLTGLAILGGLILLVIPGIIFATWFSLSAWVLVNEDAGVIDSMKKSKALVKGHFVEQLGLISFGSATNILMIVPIVGPIVIFVLAVVMSAAPAIRYLQLDAISGSGEETKPHWINYLVIVLALVGIGVNNATKKPVTTPTTPGLVVPQSSTQLQNQ